MPEKLTQSWERRPGPSPCRRGQLARLHRESFLIVCVHMLITPECQGRRLGRRDCRHGVFEDVDGSPRLPCSARGAPDFHLHRPSRCSVAHRMPGDDSSLRVSRDGPPVTSLRPPTPSPALQGPTPALISALLSKLASFPPALSCVVFFLAPCLISLCSAVPGPPLAAQTLPSMASSSGPSIFWM